MSVSLNAKFRNITGKKVKKLRKEDLIPAVVYGRGFDNQNIILKYSDFEKVYKKAGESSLVDLQIENSDPFKVVITNVQLEPLKGKILHIDFYKVRMDEKITAELSLKFVGESEAVKNLGGVLVKALDSVEISCLPSDLIHNLEVDLSVLKTFDNIIRVGDLKISQGVEVMGAKDTAVVLVEKPEKEEVKKEEEKKEVTAEQSETETEKEEKDIK